MSPAATDYNHFPKENTFPLPSSLFPIPSLQGVLCFLSEQTSKTAPAGFFPFRSALLCFCCSWPCCSPPAGSFPRPPVRSRLRLSYPRSRQALLPRQASRPLRRLPQSPRPPRRLPPCQALPPALRPCRRRARASFPVRTVSGGSWRTAPSPSPAPETWRIIGPLTVSPPGSRRVSPSGRWLWRKGSLPSAPMLSIPACTYVGCSCRRACSPSGTAPLPTASPWRR